MLRSVQKTDLRYRKIGEPNSHNKSVLLLPTSLAYNWQVYKMALTGVEFQTEGYKIELPVKTCPEISLALNDKSALQL